jgi:hypothetical protein
MTDDSRYPYTYSCDMIRKLGGYVDGSTRLSRSDASQIRQGIAQIIGVSDKNLACVIADFYLANESIKDGAVNDF